jgi:acetoacetate decarboxylase
VHAMYLDDNSPIAGGREIWGFPRKRAKPKIAHESETLVCTLHYGSVLCVSATMGYKHHELDPAPLLKSLAKPSFMIKIIPHVDCTPRICELERYYLEGVTLKGAWSGPAAIELFEHSMCDVARLPVHERRQTFSTQSAGSRRCQWLLSVAAQGNACPQSQLVMERETPYRFEQTDIRPVRRQGYPCLLT